MISRFGPGGRFLNNSHKMLYLNRGNMSSERRNMKRDEKEKEAILFLYRTKKGQYAPIDNSSLPYSRVKEEAEEAGAVQEIYYYGLA